MSQDIKQKIKIFEMVLDKVPEIRYACDSILRETTTLTTLEEGILIGKKLEQVLLKYREITGCGRGLAAPQIGENKSVFITYIDNQIEVFINPKITKKSDKTNFYKELCISAGIVAADIERSEWIIMEWMDKDGIKLQKSLMDSRRDFTNTKRRIYEVV